MPLRVLIAAVRLPILIRDLPARTFVSYYNILNPVFDGYVPPYIQLENAFWVRCIVYDFTYNNTYVFKLIYSGRKKSQPEDEFILIFCNYIHLHLWPAIGLFRSLMIYFRRHLGIYRPS